MSNKYKIMVLWALLGTGVFGLVGAVQAATGGLWYVSVPTLIVAALAARAIYWRTLMFVMTNAGDVVATENGATGRLDAIDVFWRPG